VRIQAGVRHGLEEAAGAGHVLAPFARLTEQAAARLAVDLNLCEKAVSALAHAGDVVVESTLDDDDKVVYDAGLYRAECAVSVGLRRLLDAPRTAIGVDLGRAIAWYEKSAGIELASQQAEAVRRAIQEPVVVITGGPGVGKTTIIRGIVSILVRKGLRVALAAPTGRAAKRLAEATGHPAATVHRLLEWRPAEGQFGRNSDRPLEADLLVIDEASMLDIRLSADVLAAMATGTRLLLVGDVDQLPSVGPGTVLRDVIASGSVPTVRLTEIFRQASHSLIVMNAHRIQNGELPLANSTDEDTRDFFVMEENNPGEAAELVRNLVTTRLPQHYGLHPHDIQVLTPMRRGELGVGHLNDLLQATLTAGAAEVRVGARTFREGDRVMQLRNNYNEDVFNGDTGRVISVDSDKSELVVRFDDREVHYATEHLDELALSYASTIHKAQGSEYPAVVIPVHTQHYIMLQRNLLYTAVTRAKRLVVLVGSWKALGIAVHNAEIAARGSRLVARLQGDA
jgi:exodeoxyribonuclease V alpha subunit